MSRWLMVLVIWCVGATAQAETRPALTVLLLGDSLSAAYGIPRESSWPELLRQRLAAEDSAVELVNASISGETTAGGLSRLPALLEKHRPGLLLLELGANDGLRGLSLKQMQANLTAMADAAQAQGAQTLLFAMRIPSNYGPRYSEAFHQSFVDLAQARDDVHLQPFFLASIALDDGAFLDDGIHPSAAAQPALLETVWPQLQRLLPDSGQADAADAAPAAAGNSAPATARGR